MSSLRRRTLQPLVRTDILIRLSNRLLSSSFRPDHTLEIQNQSTEEGHPRPLIPPPHFPRTPFPKHGYFQSQPTINFDINITLNFNFLAFDWFPAQEWRGPDRVRRERTRTRKRDRSGRSDVGEDCQVTGLESSVGGTVREPVSISLDHSTYCLKRSIFHCFDLRY